MHGQPIIREKGMFSLDDDVFTVACWMGGGAIHVSRIFAFGGGGFFSLIF
jgi:hypothetical protein